MVKLPPQFVATRYPGYFFNLEDEQLYSLKIGGVLKPLSFHKPNHFNYLRSHPVKLASGERVWTEGGYYVSINGRRKFYPIEALKEIKEHDATIPVQED